MPIVLVDVIHWLNDYSLKLIPHMLQADVSTAIIHHAKAKKKYAKAKKDFALA